MASCSLAHLPNECHRSVNDFWSCKYGNCEVIQSLFSITVVLAAFISKTARDTVNAPF